MTPSLLQGLIPDSFKTIRLVATDMDGTLTKSGKFTPVLLQSLTDLAVAGIQVLVVTGRSAGWVNGVVSYLPIVGAIAENGGLFYSHAEQEPEPLIALPDIGEYRRQLHQIFQHLQTRFPQIREATDNRFRITDWTFDVHGLSLNDLQEMQSLCREQGWGFTYSTVQCHIKALEQEKAPGLQKVLQQYFPEYALEQVITVGDSPNDESLFNADRFPVSVGVANVLHYIDQLQYRPAYVTQAEEVQGFRELADLLVRSRLSHPPR
ncbi:MAG TPA: HAD-IIB family hydrolase [Crinalium sp.]